MEHYTKASSHAAEREEKKEVYDIHVKSGSKIKNIISQAYRLLKVRNRNFVRWFHWLSSVLKNFIERKIRAIII